eukprot:s4865_g3.t1
MATLGLNPAEYPSEAQLHCMRACKLPAYPESREYHCIGSVWSSYSTLEALGQVRPQGAPACLGLPSQLGEDVGLEGRCIVSKPQITCWIRAGSRQHGSLMFLVEAELAISFLMCYVCGRHSCPWPDDGMKYHDSPHQGMEFDSRDRPWAAQQGGSYWQDTATPRGAKRALGA